MYIDVKIKELYSMGRVRWRVAGVLLSPVMICCVLCSARRVAAGQLSRDLLTARPAPAASSDNRDYNGDRGERTTPRHSGEGGSFLEH